MKNKIAYYFQNKIRIKVTGKNVHHFLERLINNKIELLKVDHIKYNEINVLIYAEDYSKVLDIKTIYDVKLIDIYGIIKMKKLININKFLIFFALLGIAFIVFLSNIIFKVEVIHTDSKVREFILNELQEFGIREKTFRKSFKELQTIKEAILDKYPDKIEWLEIERVGIKYIIRFEQRLIVEPEPDSVLNNVTANKNAIIKKIISDKGQIVKNIGDYVTKGEIIISGNITLYDQIKATVGAKGTVYGEVWYETTVDYPLIYVETKETGNTQTKRVLKFLNYKWQLGNTYKEQLITDKLLLNHSFLPLGVYLENQKETKTISSILTTDQALDKALELAIKKVEMTLDENEKIMKTEILNTTIQDDKVIVKVFFAVLEDITNYEPIRSDEDVYKFN